MAFSIDVNVYHHFEPGGDVAGLLKTLEALMGQLLDEVAKLETLVKDTGAAQDAAIQRVADDVGGFNKTIADLTTQIADLKATGGQDDPATVAKIQELEGLVQAMKEKADALDPTKTTTLPDTTTDPAAGTTTPDAGPIPPPTA